MASAPISRRTMPLLWIGLQRIGLILRHPSLPLAPAQGDVFVDNSTQSTINKCKRSVWQQAQDFIVARATGKKTAMVATCTVSGPLSTVVFQPMLIATIKSQKNDTKKADTKRTTTKKAGEKSRTVEEEVPEVEFEARDFEIVGEIEARYLETFDAIDARAEDLSDFGDDEIDY
ncbi:hypothetical protein V5O48_000267 [Marasmius crinis-equi]|uniref:Uncharacterized protein n=1 Tax=Marasmius crinis-equi TaxID=585013 RepID=A0ABR3G2H8_9AGAR